MSRPVLFLGPSLPRAEAERLIDADIRPPARRGHVYRAACDDAFLILLVDGAFETVPAVLHREILFALARGVPVAGAASIGALRAAELDRAGMVGCGEIYRAYRDGRLDGDDEVALLHGPAELGFAPLTEPLVTMRATLAAAVRAALVGEEERDRAIAAMKARCFRERTVEALADVLTPRDDMARRRFASWYEANRVDPKEADTRLLLAEAAAGRLDRPPVGPLFLVTTAWIEAVEDWDLFLDD